MVCQEDVLQYLLLMKYRDCEEQGQTDLPCCRSPTREAQICDRKVLGDSWWSRNIESHCYCQGIAKETIGKTLLRDSWLIFFKFRHRGLSGIQFDRIGAKDRIIVVLYSRTDRDAQVAARFVDQDCFYCSTTPLYYIRGHQQMYKLFPKQMHELCSPFLSRSLQVACALIRQYNQPKKYICWRGDRSFLQLWTVMMCSTFNA